MTKRIVAVLLTVAMMLSLAIVAGAVTPVNNTSYNFNYDEGKLIIPYNATAAVIDGDGSDAVWNYALKTSLTYENAGMIYVGNATNEHASVTAYYYWNYSGLYVKFEVVDPTAELTSPYAGNTINGHDCVQLFMNPRLRTGPVGSEVDSFIFSFAAYSCAGGNENVSVHPWKDSETGPQYYVDRPYWQEAYIFKSGDGSDAFQSQIEMASKVNRVDASTGNPVSLTDANVAEYTTIVTDYVLEMCIPATTLSETLTNDAANYYFYAGRQNNFGLALVDKWTDIEGQIATSESTTIADYIAAGVFHLGAFIGDYGTRSNAMNEDCGRYDLYTKYVYGPDYSITGQKVTAWQDLCTWRDAQVSSNYAADKWLAFTAPLDNMLEALEAGTINDSAATNYVATATTAKAALTGAPVAPTLSSISVTTLPSKTTYTVGEAFNSAGLVVTAYYSDSTASVVNASVSAPDMTTAGTKTVTVSFEGKTATFTITVNAAAPQVLKGDIDGNGSVSTADARLALMYALGQTDAFPASAFDAADYDSNSAVNTADARLILMTALGSN